MDDNTWIKLFRRIENNKLYFSERFTKIMAWVDLLIMANFKDGCYFKRGNEIKVNRGQVGRSIITLAKRWQWNERTVKSFLDWLQKEEMIHYKTNHLTTIITILNWNEFQGGTEQSTEQSTEQTQNRIQTNKKDKKEKKDIIEPFAEKPAPKTIVQLVHKRAIEMFVKIHFDKFNTEYKFSGADAKHMQTILKNLYGMMKKDKTEENLLLAFEYFIKGISDKWLLNNFLLKNINSNFNSIITKLKNGNNGLTKSGIEEFLADNLRRLNIDPATGNRINQ